MIENTRHTNQLKLIIEVLDELRSENEQAAHIDGLQLIFEAAASSHEIKQTEIESQLKMLIERES